MAKAITLTLIILVGGAMLMFWEAAQISPQERKIDSYESRRVIIRDSEALVWVADTPEKRAQGLMFVESLPLERGMLFTFADEDIRTFWNKNTLVDLDIIWIRDNVILGTSSLFNITENNIIRVISPGPADMVLEVNANWSSRKNVQVGDRIVVE